MRKKAPRRLLYVRSTYAGCLILCGCYASNSPIGPREPRIKGRNVFRASDIITVDLSKRKGEGADSAEFCFGVFYLAGSAFASICAYVAFRSPRRITPDPQIAADRLQLRPPSAGKSNIY